MQYSIARLRTQIANKMTRGEDLSLVTGAERPPLTTSTLAQLSDKLSKKYSAASALIVSWSKARISFDDLNEQSKAIARGLLGLGVRKGDRVAIFSGDDERYLELFLAVGRIGAILVTLNKSYTWQECEAAIRASGMLLIFLFAIDVRLIL